MLATAVPTTATARVFMARATMDEVAWGEHWLTEAECAVGAALRIPTRRADWRLGRWVAKRALLACAAGKGFGVGLGDIEIFAQAGGAPAARIATTGGSLAAKVSISHRDGVGLAAASLDDVAIGCDVERIEPRSSAFVTDYFTVSEQALIAAAAPRDRDATIMLLWSAKESALKALGEGLRLDTRAVAVEEVGGSAPGQRAPLAVRGPAGQLFTGWAWLEDHHVTTLVADRGILLNFAHLG